MVWLFFGWRHFSKKEAGALSTKVVDKFVDFLWTVASLRLEFAARSATLKCSSAFSGKETARYG